MWSFLPRQTEHDDHIQEPSATHISRIFHQRDSRLSFSLRYLAAEHLPQIEQVRVLRGGFYPRLISLF
jgi:hypothetical protein